MSKYEGKKHDGQFRENKTVCKAKEKRYASHVKQARATYISAYSFFSFPFHLTGIIFALLLQLPPFRNSYPGSHSRHPPPPLRPTAYCGTRLDYLSREETSIFFPRRLSPYRAKEHNSIDNMDEDTKDTPSIPQPPFDSSVVGGRV